MSDDEGAVGAPTPLPLDGLLVADFSRILAGPYATMLLADLGADVVKVESPSGDDTRAWQPPARDGVATYYLSVNRNKRSVALDLTAEADVALARELARRADVVVENFKPGGLARFGLDYASVAATNPRAVYASVSGFGSGGGAHLAGYDLLAQAVSGFMSLTGEAEGPPLKGGVAVFDVMAGLHLTVAVLAALQHRHTTGVGQRVEVNLLSAALSGLVNHTSAYVAGDVVPHRMGNGHPSIYPYDPFPVADGQLVVIAGNDLQFGRLCNVLGRPDLLSDSRFATNRARATHRDELRPLLSAVLLTRTKDEWFDRLTAAGVPCGPINSIAEGVSLATDLGLEPVVEIGPDGASTPSVRNPVTYSATPPRYDLPPPSVDEHGAELRAWLSAPAAGEATAGP